jgi:hypothetical protein
MWGWDLPGESPGTLRYASMKGINHCYKRGSKGEGFIL